jgi:ferritin-like metal-binding protein YciE
LILSQKSSKKKLAIQKPEEEGMANNKNHKQFYNLFIDRLQDIYSAENQLAEKMPTLMKSISSEELREALKSHFKETKKQKDRLEKVFKELKVTPNKKTCEGMKGLLKECEKLVDAQKSGVVKDAAIISALQKCEHYEIATYGALRTFAKHLELSKTEDILQEILDEEWDADSKLTTIAEGSWFTSGINAEAVAR